MKKVELTESDIKLITQRVLEQEERIFIGNDDQFKKLLFDYTEGYGHFLNKLYDKFIITTHLRLRSNQIIRTLPDNLEVKGYVSLSLSSIMVLPKNLTISSALSIGCTSIKWLPKTLKCNVIYAIKTPIARDEGLLKHYKEDRGLKFNMSDTC